MQIVDSHCHLDYPDFVEDKMDVLQRAADANIDYMMTISVKLEKIQDVIDTANLAGNIFATVGIHPHYADQKPEDSKEILQKYAQHPKIVGLGETGLDYFYEKSSPKAQHKSFMEHIEVSQETQLPLIIHTRDAEADTISILTQAKKKCDFPFLLHCFTGTEYLAQAALDLGGYISISGIVTFKSASDLQKTVQNIPLGRLLVETDAPYLSPIPHRGKRNEPAFTRYTLDKIAELKQLPPQDIALATTQNYFDLFKKAEK